MMRALGFLTGTGLTVAAFLLVLDSEDSRPPQTESEHSANATAEQLSVVAAAIAERLDAVKAGTASDPAKARQPEPAGTGTEPRDGAQSAATAPAPQAGEDHLAELEQQARADDAGPAHNAPASTYLFWSPFRSAWAAQGFAGRLTAATQVPVEVVAAGPGNYRVAFSYQDETERQARVQRIETITGLELE